MTGVRPAPDAGPVRDAVPVRPRRRVDPFVLPASTTSQFVLLAVLTLVTASYTYDLIIGGATRWEDRYGACAVAAAQTGLVDPPLSVTRQYVSCFTDVNYTRAAVSVLAAAAVAAAVALAVTLHARLIRRREGLVPFDPDAFPAAAAVIDRSVREAGLHRTPTFVVEPFRAGPGGRAFGSWRRDYVRLSLGLLREPDGPALPAIVRHELAHVRNRDLVLTSVAVVVPYVFVAVVVVPLLVVVALRAPASLVPVGWQVLLLALLLLLIRAAIFRSREHHADVRASVGPDGEPLPVVEHVFADAPVRRGERVRRWLAAHPRLRERVAVVAEPGRLMTPRFAENLATGLITGVTFCYLRNALLTVVGGDQYYAAVVAGALVGLLVAAVGGIGMWRAALAASANDGRLPTGARPGAGLALGLLLGEVLSPTELNAWPRLVFAHPVLSVVAALVLGAGCVVFLRWSVTSAATWLAASRARNPRTALWWGVPIGALAFGTAYGSWFTAVTAASVSDRPAAFFVVLTPIGAPVLLPLLAALAFPLVAATRARGPVSVPREVYLDEPRTDRLPIARTRPVLVLLPAAVLAAGLVLVDSTITHGLVLPLITTLQGVQITNPYEDLRLGNLLILLVIAVVLQLLVTAVVGALCGPGSVRTTFAHPVLAGALTGAGLGFGLLSYPMVVTCMLGCQPVSLAAGTGAAVSLTAVIALVTAALVWAVTAGIAALRGRTRLRPQPEVFRSRWRTRGLTAATVLTAVVVVLPTMFSAAVTTGVVSPDRLAVPSRLLAARFDAVRNSPVETCRSFLQLSLGANFLEQDYAPALGVARSAQLSGSPALYAIGIAWERAILVGDTATIALTGRALYPICVRTVPATTG